MIELNSSEMAAALPLFADRDVYLLARSMCEGLVPCRVFADNAACPTAAIVVLKRFGIAYAAGDARHAPALLDCLRGWHPWYEINDPEDAWHPALAAWSQKSHATVRYAFTNAPSTFDVDRLRALATPPDGCEVRPYDAALVDQALSAAWSEDQTGGFLSTQAFLAEGLGMAVIREGRLVAGCASFARHADGYEIQVDTMPEERGRGLASCASAAFILECLRRGMNPCWDAANAASLRLAEKLGFVLTRAYPAWMLVAPSEDTAAVAQKVVGPTE